MEAKAAVQRPLASSAKEDFVTLNVEEFLKTRPAVKNVQRSKRIPATLADLDEWETNNSPYKLPSDLKNFFLLSDGLCIQWTAAHKQDNHPVGCIQVNPLHKLKQISLTKFTIAAQDSVEIESSDEEDDEGSSKDRTDQDSKALAAFDIDATCRGGRIALLYQNGDTQKPQVWFQALSCKWYFVAENFTNYFRLLVLHLGLPYWYYAYTDIGLDPITQQWLRLLLPQRLEIDRGGMKALLQQQKNKEEETGDGKRASAASTSAALQQSYDFDDNSTSTGKGGWKMPRAVVKISLKKIDKYARQLKAKQRKPRVSRRGDDT
eukprot:jgi/Bigna1/85773/estExt_fgenesh1_pg.C_60070